MAHTPKSQQVLPQKSQSKISTKSKLYKAAISEANQHHQPNQIGNSTNITPISKEDTLGTQQEDLDKEESLVNLASPPAARSLIGLSPSNNIQRVDSSLTNTNITSLIKRYQPSKVFLTRCEAEQKTLLDSIKPQFHSEIKTIQTEEQYTDFFIKIGEDFQKALNKCLVASRAYKFYNTLKAFEVIKKEDINISEFLQESSADQSIGSDSGLQSSSEQTSSQDTEPISNANNLEDFVCILPADLISPDLFLNFVRRIFTDQDISLDEADLQKRLVDWIKVHKPHLIKKRNTTKPIKPNIGESFRTIQTEFKDLSITIDNTNSSTTMSPPPKNLVTPATSPIQTSLKSEVLANEMDTNDNKSAKEENLLCSLTRTETFELITKSNPDSPSINNSSKNSQVGSDIEPTTAGGTADSSNDETAYAPTTRTGLKPKTFTTPKDLVKTSTPKAATTTGSIARKSSATTPTISSRAKVTLSDQVSSAASKLITKPEQTTSSPKPINTTSSMAMKKTTHNDKVNNNNNIANNNKPQSISNTNTSTTSSKNVAATNVVTSKPVAKPTLITRAHPISMERSQSPATNSLTPARNFIAANKRIVSQMKNQDNKSPANLTSKIATPDCVDSELDSSELSSSLLSRQVTSDNIVAQLDDFSLISQSKLVDSLSRLFLDSLLADTILLVKDGKQVKAHKCILSARSPYFLEIIAKHEKTQQHASNSKNNMTDQSDNDNSPPAQINDKLIRLDLTAFSYQSVYFSAMHIYTGLVKIFEDVDMDELAKLSHLLHVQSLRQVCTHELRMNYCHFFHKPCNVCSLGVLKTLPIAWRYDFTDLYSKCLQWIGNNFSIVFSLQEFSELKPTDLIEECYSATLAQLTPDNIIPKTIECQKLLKSLPRVKWTESIICLVGRLVEEFCHYVADNYEIVLQSESFLNLGKNCWECEVLEENLLAAMNHLKPDSGCKTLIQLNKLECTVEAASFDDQSNISDSFASLISKMRKYCERYLLKEAPAVVHCNSWRHMNPSLQKRIKDQAVLSTDFDEPNKKLANKPKIQSIPRPGQRSQNTASNQTFRLLK